MKQITRSVYHNLFPTLLFYRLNTFHNHMTSSSQNGQKFRNFHWSSRPEVFYKKRVLRNFAKFTIQHLCQRLCLCQSLWHRCFPVNFAKFLRTPFFTEHLRWQLLFPPVYIESPDKVFNLFLLHEVFFFT